MAGGVLNAFGEGCRRQRTADEVTLGITAIVFSQYQRLFDGFDAFSHDREAKTGCQANDGINNCGIGGIAGDFMNKGSIDLQGIYRKSLKVGKR